MESNEIRWRSVRFVIVICVAVLGGWLFQKVARWQPSLALPAQEHELCLLSTTAGEGRFEKTFSSRESVPQCHVVVQFTDRGEPVRLSLSGPNGASFNGLVQDGTQFSWGRDFPPNASISMALDQGVNHPGVTVIVADRPFVRAGLNGWQILTRVWVVLFVVSGLLAWANRKSAHLKRQQLSAYVFKIVAIALAGMFFYLFFHEGGHAVAKQVFGGGGFRGSDFWGIHGSPHAGGVSENFKPWQRAVTYFAGPATPTLAGWLLFLWWRSRRGQDFRSRRATFDLFLTCLVAFLVLPYAVVTGPMMIGLLSDGDWEGFIRNVPDHLWLVYLLLTVSVLVSMFILWRTFPHIYVLFRIETERMRNTSGLARMAT